ncbi:MAG: B12-binding domain-containing radical SAM protein [Phycisphaerales bacterium]|nr:B12-binding domain-containing radical SAM protein [Phycisphaerales bacterium]
MRIGFIAMSGVRVQDQELLALGLTLPGFVERSEVIASLPSLGLLTLAALTPNDVEISYHEVDDLERDRVPDLGFDLVAISTMTAQALDAYALADQFREAGITVVMGGLHATCVPDECEEHADAVVVGEGEPVWEQLVEDFRNGQLKPRYESDGSYPFDHTPIPRYDLLEVEKYNRLTVQTTRGCPHKCDFCASSIMLTPGYKVKPTQRVIEEIRAIKAIWENPFIELADDNSFMSRAKAYELLEAMIPERIHWFTECDVSIAKDDKLLDLMARAGCRQVLIGLESPDESGLDGIESNSNWKLAQYPKYEEAVRIIQSKGITVIGCFVLGLDGHTSSAFDAVYEFAKRTNLYDVQVTLQTPFPGTPLYKRLESEGRLTHPGQWDRCTLFDLNYKPLGMTSQQLETGFRDLVARIYDPAFIRRRQVGFLKQLRSVS